MQLPQMSAIATSLEGRIGALEAELASLTELPEDTLDQDNEFFIGPGGETEGGEAGSIDAILLATLTSPWEPLLLDLAAATPNLGGEYFRPEVRKDFGKEGRVARFRGSFIVKHPKAHLFFLPGHLEPVRLTRITVTADQRDTVAGEGTIDPGSALTLDVNSLGTEKGCFVESRDDEEREVWLDGLSFQIN